MSSLQNPDNHLDDASSLPWEQRSSLAILLREAGANTRFAASLLQTIAAADAECADLADKLAYLAEDADLMARQVLLDPLLDPAGLGLLMQAWLECTQLAVRLVRQRIEAVSRGGLS